MKTIQEATTYIIESMKNVDDQETFDDVDEDIVQDQIIEGLLDKVETELDQDDLQTLDERSDDAIFVGEFLQRRFPNFGFLNFFF